MPKPLLISLALIVLLLSACQSRPQEVHVNSPDGNIALHILNNRRGDLHYWVEYRGKRVIDTSRLGVDFYNSATLDKDLTIRNVKESAQNETWEMPWGEQREVRDHHNAVLLQIQERERPYRQFEVAFKVFDDGVAFRYQFPEQENLDTALIQNELTEFKLTGDHKAWWIPADYDSYEYLYTQSRVSEIDASLYEDIALAQRSIDSLHAVNTPVTLKVDDSTYLSVHEANLSRYSGMTLLVDPDKRTLRSSLVPGREEYAVASSVPFHSPWRTIQIAPTAGSLIASTMLLNLNEPSKIDDTEWIEPMKYAGIWWEMHLGIATWQQGGKHGATTARARELIDFAAANGLRGVLIEGWNTGWEGSPAPDQPAFDFTTPYPDFDLKAVVAYAKEKGIVIIGHHETMGDVSRYEERLDSAFALYQQLGIPAVKTGYVGKIKPEGEHHHGQWMVEHYQRVAEMAAKHKISIIAHEPIKATGLRRTWPNFLAREGVRGSEFNAPWGDGNPPAHLTIVPFTRMLAGPIDYTPGLFMLDLDQYKAGHKVPTTLAWQLAAYVVINSPVQMASDLPEHYEGHPAMQFIRDVPVNWEQSLVLNGEIGQYITIARQERGTDNWYIGSISNEEGRDLSISLDFLPEGKRYLCIQYMDAPEADDQSNTNAYLIKNSEVVKGDQLQLQLAPGGGQAISLQVIGE